MTTTRKQYSPAVQGAGGDGGDPGREDAEPVGIAVQGASDADREVEEVGDGATAGAFCGWADAEGRERSRPDNDALYEEIGRLKVELDWLKKKVGMLD